MTGSHEVVGSIPISSTMKSETGLRDVAQACFGFALRVTQGHPHPALRVTKSALTRRCASPSPRGRGC